MKKSKELGYDEEGNFELTLKDKQEFDLKKCKHNVYIQNCALCNTKEDKQILHRKDNNHLSFDCDNQRDKQNGDLIDNSFSSVLSDLTSEFNLSDKIWSSHEIKVKLADDVISVSNVKEFIKRLKEETGDWNMSGDFKGFIKISHIHLIINKLAGKKLI